MKTHFSHPFAWSILAQEAEDRGVTAHGNEGDVASAARNKASTLYEPKCLDALSLESELSCPLPKRSEDGVATKLKVDGWQFGASLAAVSAGITAVVNLVVASVLFKDNRRLLAGGSSTLISLYTGSCEKTASLSSWTHLAVNIASTILLAGSNFTMQCLMAPTRADVDRCHGSARWLDIGLPSARNLRHVGRLRRFLWVLLVLTSLPLHLVFNSAFFSSIANNEYDVVFADQGYLEGDAFNYTDTVSDLSAIPAAQSPFEIAKKVQDHYMRSPSDFVRIENQQCIDAYANIFITDRRSVIVVTNDRSATPKNGAVQLALSAEPLGTTSRGHYQWVCPQDEDVRSWMQTDGPEALQKCNELVSKGDIQGHGWRPANLTAEYCLSEKISGQCSFYANMAILWIVFACNLIKLVIMCYTRFSAVITKPLMTIGDAVASFIVDPDPTTVSLGPTGAHDIQWIHSRIQPSGFITQIVRAGQESALRVEEPWSARERQWTPAARGPRLATAASRTRWAFTTTYYLLYMVTIGALLHVALKQLQGDTSLPALYAIGLGKTDLNFIIHGWAIQGFSRRPMSVDSSVVSSILVANLPHLALSIWYFAANSLLTLMASSLEWSRYSLAWAAEHRARGLRTSRPRGDQRRTYFLQLPYRFAVPLMGVSALIHWLISQSIFLVVIADYSGGGDVRNLFSVASVGYSPVGIIFVIMASSVLMLSLIAFGLFRMEPGMPVVASSSAAISSCCHVSRPVEMSGGAGDVSMSREAREEMVKRPLVWGRVGGDSERMESLQGVGDGGGTAERYEFVSAAGLDCSDSEVREVFERNRLA